MVITFILMTTIWGVAMSPKPFHQQAKHMNFAFVGLAIGMSMAKPCKLAVFSSSSFSLEGGVWQRKGYSPSLDVFFLWMDCALSWTGFTLFVEILATGNYTGACANPARHFGPALVSGKFRFVLHAPYFFSCFPANPLTNSAAFRPHSWNNWWVFYVGPFLGATVSTLVFVFVFPTGEEEDKE